MGSRSQLVSPAVERPTTAHGAIFTDTGAPAAAAAGGSSSIRSPSSGQLAGDASNLGAAEFASSAAKRESFVETGFLETLKPQFTPGFSLTTPLAGSATTLSAEEKLHALQQQQISDDLKAQVRDLSEKLETLKQRRNEDKERLREFDKMKTQFDQLQEFKAKIMDAQSQLQRELQRARQETKDAIEARDQHIEEMSELSENVELITLDKEMAEEKADTLQLELEAARDRCEELKLDLDILKAEVQNRSATSAVISASGEKVADGNGVSSFEFKQMEQQNARLRETLVRLRDLSAHEKHEIQKMSKELETSKSEVLELHRTKEKLSAKVRDSISRGYQVVIITLTKSHRSMSSKHRS